MPQVTPNFDLS